MKIFCIGLSKTGTTSLTEALKILGYDAVHWYATKHAFRYTDDGGIDIDWDFFERHDAFADTPIARIYPQLDERYPDAKFILTLRDLDAWLDSFAAQFRKGGLDAFSARLHRDLYGTESYDADACAAAFRDHTRRVRRHFQDCREKLLELKLGAGGDWQSLCRFVGVPEPSSRYPHRFSRAERTEDERAQTGIRGLLNRFDALFRQPP